MTTDARPAEAARPKRPARRLILLARRAHLYFVLFLFPWAILYGVTAFLFNHPTAFSDQPTTTFDAATTLGTPLETLPTPGEFAGQVVAKLNELQSPATPYELVGDSKYGREFAFATVKGDGQTVSLLLDAAHGGGTIRSAPAIGAAEPERAPFAVGAAPAAPRGLKTTPTLSSGGLTIVAPLHERFHAAIPVILARTGFPAGEATVTSVPDLVFTLRAGGRDWAATYSPMAGTLAGIPAGDKPPAELGWRRFLLKLHTAHGYPAEANGRWAWAAVVDAMAFALCFWACTGLVMWWQIKAARKLGLVVLSLSAVSATTLGFAMHAAMTG